MSDTKHQRSKAYPRIGIEEAIQIVKEIHRAVGSGPFSREAVAESMGLSPKSGYANSKTAAMVHYGFLSRTGSSYKMTALADRVLHPTHIEEERDAAIEAIRNPTLFVGLFDRFNGNPLPSLLPNILARDFGISGKQADDVAEIFRSSVDFVGLLRNGILHKDPGTNSSDPPPDHNSNKEQQLNTVVTRGSAPTYIGTTTTGTALGSRQYQIPLRRSEVAVLSLPSHVEQRDLERIKQWIDLMEDALTDIGE